MSTAVIAWIICIWLLLVLPARIIMALARRKARRMAPPVVTVVHQYPHTVTTPAGRSSESADGSLSWGVRK